MKKNRKLKEFLERIFWDESLKNKREELKILRGGEEIQGADKKDRRQAGGSVSGSFDSTKKKRGIKGACMGCWNSRRGGGGKMKHSEAV